MGVKPYVLTFLLLLSGLLKVCESKKKSIKQKSDSQADSRRPIAVVTDVVPTYSFEFRSNNPKDVRFTSGGLYQAAIQEITPLGTAIKCDMKMGVYSLEKKVGFVITSGNERRDFKVQSRHVKDFYFMHITSARRLNRESTPTYLLTIVAQDIVSKKTLDITKVNITVKDSNDNRPIFLQRRYAVSVAENIPMHSSIAKIQAVDADVGSNGLVYYSFKEKTNAFAINPMSGVVTVTRNLDSTRDRVQTLTVVARDRGLKSKSTKKCKITIRVQPVNQFSPEITIRSQLSSVDEGSSGQVYATLQVTDNDKGVNGHIGRLEITSGNRDGAFSIQSPSKDLSNFTSKLTIVKALDRESAPYGFNLTVTAFDAGNPSKNTSIRLQVFANDVNDNNPAFKRSSYQAKLSELSPPHSPVIRVIATDKDAGSNGEISYAITRGNGDGKFEINSKTGQIYTTNYLDFESKQSYDLQVAALDGAPPSSRRLSNVGVLIQVLDANDHSPNFHKSTYDKDLYEDLTAGTSVFSVSAKDKDYGDNGKIRYSIANVYPVPFSIDEKTGDIKAMTNLDRDLGLPEYIHLQVRASDFGTPMRRESETIVKFRIHAMNDNSPVLKQYKCDVSLDRNAPPGVLLTTIQAADVDLGDMNQQISFKFTFGNTGNTFRLDSKTGQLRTAKTLESAAKEFTLYIKAFDGIQESSDSHPAILKVNIISGRAARKLSNHVRTNCIDSPLYAKALETQQKQKNKKSLPVPTASPKIRNRHTPVFMSHDARVYVKEDAAIGTMIKKFVAVDQDKGFNGLVVYSIVKGDTDSVFDIDMFTGVLSIKRTLDRELTDSYTLNISASDCGKRHKTAFTTLHIILLDVNDNSPIFQKSKYDVNLKEDVTIGQTVEQVKAVDKDKGTNGELRYELVNDFDNKFRIDQATGIISVISSLDYEEQPSYVIKVKAVDVSPDNPKESYTELYLNLIDVNDNPPSVKPDTFNISVPEDLLTEAVITTILAVDPDSGPGGDIEYKLLEGKNKFKIDQESGVIRLRRKLDHERVSTYNVTVRVSDKGNPRLSSDVHIVVNALNVNENRFAPVFTGGKFLRAAVFENLDAGTIVLYVKATDKEKDSWYVKYAIIDGTGVDKFIIDPDTGAIRTTQKLDHEEADHYWLTVQAKDGNINPLYTNIPVLIDVVDVNDEAPYFSPLMYYPEVPENKPSGTAVVNVTAIDPDSNGSRLTYKITKGNDDNLFSINPRTGVITTVTSLDREMQPEHTLTVRVSDGGRPEKFATVSFTVEVTDENDHAPQFTEVQYTVSTLPRKASSKPSQVIDIFASDKDVGSNADLTYSIVHGNRDGKMYIDSKAGIIYCASDLVDGDVFDLIVNARDGGHPSRSTNATVTIDVVLENAKSSNPPSFYESTNTASIAENADIGSFVAGLMADDPDYDQLRYSITAGNVGNKFTIERFGGFVTVARALDREEKSSYSLTITASDGYNSADAKLDVTILDINDHAPQPKRKQYRANAAEDAIPGTLVITVKATDPDSGVNGEVEYKIVGSSRPKSTTLFKINSITGKITTTKTLDYEDIKEHVLIIKAADRGSPKMSTMFSVVISVVDVNDHKPMFVKPKYEAEVDVNAAIGSPILKVVATDRDDGVNAKLKYTIAKGNANGSMSVDQNSGLVRVSNKLSRHVKEYELKIQAADGGNPSLMTQTTVKIKVHGIMKNLSFDRPIYEASIKENSPPGQALVRVIYNGIMPVYEIIPSKSDCWKKFEVQRQSGVIVNKVHFDAESLNKCKFQVNATSISGQQSTALVVITVLDQNDNPPVFVHKRFVGHVAEGIAVGTPVLNSSGLPLVTSATDMDITENDKLTYEIVDANARSVFAIHPATGAITTNRALDYETASTFNFKVKATDPGDPKLSSFTDVTIQVLDINDVAPVFSTTTYHATVYLPTVAYTLVVKVTATDADSPVLTYSLADEGLAKMFQIDAADGTVTVKNGSQINRGTYKLTVHVTDGNFSSKVHVRVLCKQLPLGSLQFRESNYTASVLEGVTTEHELLAPQVIGYPIGETITFSIVNPSELFQISPSTGVVTIKGDKKLDRESIDLYNVVVQARDSNVPPEIAQTVLHVIVDDVNDNSPVFVGVPYYIVLQLGIRVDSKVGRVKAEDADIGSNGELRYILKGGDDGRFKINHKTGDIIVRKSLDDVIVPKLFTLIVEAHDKGQPRFSVETEVKVKVVDRETPVFDQLSFSKQVAENARVGDVITHVTARSPSGADVLYSITKGDPINQFNIDFKTGIVTVAASLDYETTPDYKLIVRATDAKTSAHAEVVVDVMVIDVNDIAPVFNQSFYLAKTSEGTPLGTPVLTVQAVDGDSGINKQISYSIQNASQLNQYFTINKTSGVLSVAKALDYDTLVVHEMIVVASDGGVPVLTGEARVRVVLQDANDNPPAFEKSMYAASILGNAGPGHFVMRVIATDPDYSDVTNLKYSIISGKGKEHFHIDSKSGVITLSRVVGIKRGKVYGLEISVTDGTHTANSRVRIIIGDTNSHSPVFAKDVYQVDFNENYPEGTFVTMVSATDMDSGNYARVKYAIDSVDAMRRFRIDADSGMLYSRLMFDRENDTQAVMSVPVRATDGGGRFGFCTVKVVLIDDNDNQPKFEFKKYDTTISRSIVMGTPILMTSAIDNDAGSNSDLTYLILGHQTPPIFSIGAKTGIIKVVREAEVKTYNFFVLVKDNGSPKLNSFVPVKVNVLANDVKILHFDKSKYEVKVMESALLGEIVTSSKLVIPTGTSPSIQYTIVNSNSPSNLHGNKFKVDSSGRIRVAGLLDYELTKRYVMVVEANASSINQVARTAVVVNVKDVNDNKPLFVSNPYLVSIPENIDIGSKVLRVFAEDLDSGKNGEVVYKVDTNDALVKQKFDIDATSGWITTKGTFDREDKEAFVFEVRATDKGKQGTLHSKTTIRAVILDVNDSPPKFSKSVFTTSVKEDALIGQTVTTITATDADLKSDLFYFILSGDPQAKFGIERKTGAIFVNGPLDRETVASYKLNVSASDGLFTSFSQVKITIDDANDNAPICSQSIYIERVPENVKVGSRVMTIIATDADVGVNALLNYTVYGQGAGVFTVDRLTGQMTTLTLLDREKRPFYNFMVSAADIAGQSCFTNVTIHLIDVNDNPPELTQRHYIASVYEDAPLKKVLLQVKADDPDVGVNRKITYSLISNGDGTFEIEAGTGMLSLIKSLNRERRDSYSLKVKAQDGGVPPQSSTATVKIKVLNINDVPPEFSSSVYRTNISESAIKGERVITVHAINRESSKEDMTYRILPGPDSHMFRIHGKSGTIRVKRRLDYEKQKVHTLTVQASDTGPPVLTSTASVVIDVIDYNDNTPVFSEREYSSTVEENSNPGAFVLQVFATDKDSGDNGKIQYSIVSGNDGGRFVINEGTGILSVAESIDRETASEFNLLVRARDKGKPFRQSETVARIIATDVNDNAPTLSTSNISINIKENTALQSTVYHLQPQDNDGPGNGAPFTFTLISGGSSSFAVDQTTGVISNIKAVSRGDYKLRIQIVDSGHPPQRSEVTVTVKVKESIIHSPKVHPLTIYVNLYNSYFNGGVIGRVKGTDDDGDKLLYSLVNAPQISSLSIDEEGTVSAQPSLASGVHNLSVSVSDGRFTVYSHVIVFVSDVTVGLQENSLTLRLYQMTAGTFVEKNFEKFKSFLGRLVGAPSRNVLIWSMQSADRDLDVVVSIKKRRRGLFESSYIASKLNASQPSFESTVGVRLHSIIASQCQLLDCPQYLTCNDIYKPENKQIRIMSDKTSYISYEHSRSHTCTCDDRSGGCAAAKTKCSTKPCAPGYKCTDFPQGYQCNCIDPNKCDMDAKGCEDVTCIKGSNSLSFIGNSYLRYRLKETINQPSRSVGLAVKTVKKEGTLVFAAGPYDYSILEIVKGFIQLRFDFGSGAGVVSIDWVPVNDGKWHHVAVERQGNHAKVILDHGKHQASGQSPGRMRILNLKENSIYFGAKVINSRVKRSNGKQPVILNGFVGCMQNMNLNGKDLPLAGSNNLATGHPANVETGCSTSRACSVANTCPRASKCIETFTGRRCDCLPGHSGPECKPFVTCKNKPCQNGGQCTDSTDGYKCTCRESYKGYQCGTFVGSCASSPCKHGGTCTPEKSGNYRCTCPRGVRGANCEFDQRPCSSSPCMFNGNCTNVGDDFVCSCPSGFSGKTCTEGFHCNRSPCLNGGICDVKNNQAVCNCLEGYAGLDCSQDVNECASNPCKNNGVCVNTFGSFHCNCSISSYGGPRCGTVLAAVTPDQTKWLSMEAIIGIGVVIAVLLLLVLIIVIVLRRRAKRKRELKRDGDKVNRNSVLKVSPPVVGSTLNSPTPPTPPPRIPDEQPPGYEEEETTWRPADNSPPSFGGTTKSLNNSESNVERYHWDYTDIPTDLVLQRPLNRQKSASYMGVPDDTPYDDDDVYGPRIPERSASMMSSQSSGLDAPEVPQRPRNYRPSESDDQYLEVPPMPRRRNPSSKCPSSRYSMDSEYSDMTDLDYCKSVGGDSAYPDLFKGRFPRPPREPYPESVDTLPVGPYQLTNIRDSELGSMTDFSDDDIERVYLGNSRMEACGDSPENTYLHSENGDDDDRESDCFLHPEDPDFHQTLQNEIKEMMDQLEELKMESEL